MPPRPIRSPNGPRTRPDHRLAGYRLPPRRDIRRRRNQLFLVLRSGRPGGTLSDRRQRPRDPDRTRRGRRFRLARVPADHHPRTALWVPGARTVGPCQRRPVRPQQASAGPVRQVLPRRFRLQSGVVLLRPERRGSRLRWHSADGRFTRPHHDQRRDQPVLRLGFRPPPAHPVSRDDHLRGSRQGYDPDASADSGRITRYLLRPRTPGGDRASQVAECHRDRTDADPPVHAR